MIKRRHIYAAALMLAMVISFNGYSEDYFYGDSIKFEVWPIAKLYLLQTDVDVDSIKSDLIKSAKKDNPYALDASSRNPQLGFISIVTSEASQTELERLAGVCYVSPGYGNSNYLSGDTIFLPGIILVDIRSQEDVPILQGIAGEYNWNISIEDSRVTLLCGKTSTRSLLQMSSTLYELGINGREWVIPKNVYGAAGGDGTSGVSNKGRTSSNAANIAVRQTGRVLKISTPDRAAASRYGVELYSVSGKRQRVSPVYHADGVITVALPHVAAGSYILRVVGGKSGMDRRVLVR